MYRKFPAVNVIKTPDMSQPLKGDYRGVRIVPDICTYMHIIQVVLKQTCTRVALTSYATCELLDLVCLLYPLYIFLMFCGPGQPSGCSDWMWAGMVWGFNPYPTAFPYGNGMVLHFYQQQESSTTKTVHKVINKGLKTYV